MTMKQIDIEKPFGVYSMRECDNGDGTSTLTINYPNEAYSTMEDGFSLMEQTFGMLTRGKLIGCAAYKADVHRPNRSILNVYRTQTWDGNAYISAVYRNHEVIRVPEEIYAKVFKLWGLIFV